MGEINRSGTLPYIPGATGAGGPAATPVGQTPDGKSVTTGDPAAVFSSAAQTPRDGVQLPRDLKSSVVKGDGKAGLFAKTALSLAGTIQKAQIKTDALLTAVSAFHAANIASGGPKRIFLPGDLRQVVTDACTALTDAVRQARGDAAKRGENLQIADIALPVVLLNRAAAALKAAAEAAASPALERLETMLGDTEMCGEVRKVCDQGYFSENLDFLLAVREARQKPDAERAAAYQAIHTDFVKAGAQNQVNLPSSMARDIANALSNQSSSGDSEASGDAFKAVDRAMDSAYQEIRRMVGEQASIKEFLNRQ